MGQRYEGTLIIQTSDYYSPVGSRVLASLSNPASADDIANGKGLYDGNGVLLNGSFIDGWPLEISTEENMDAFITLENVGRYVKYMGTASRGGGTPVPVNPIADGDIIEAVYFNTSVTPDLSAFDFNNPDSETSGGGSAVRRINFFKVSLGSDSLDVQIAAMYPDGLEGDVIYVIGAGDWSSYMYSESTKYKPSSYGLKQWGWTSSTLLEGIGQFTVSNVKNQDIWGSYVSKDGLWSNGSKYTSGQVYKVVQNGDIVELKEIQY